MVTLVSRMHSDCRFGEGGDSVRRSTVAGAPVAARPWLAVLSADKTSLRPSKLPRSVRRRASPLAKIIFALLINFRRGGDSKLTASVHLCDFRTAEPLKNIAKLFESLPASKAVCSLSPHNENIALRACFPNSERGRFELPIPCGMPVFETGAFDHSATSPSGNHNGCPGHALNKTSQNDLSLHKVPHFLLC